MASQDVTGMTKSITEYGMGVVAVAILFVMVLVLVGVLIKIMLDNNANHRKEMVPVLKALTESLDTLSETQMAFKELLIEKFADITRQGEATHQLLQSHAKDGARIETTLNVVQTSMVKTEERTKACLEHRRKTDT